ncbi:hypothetical protein [Ramlibacter sp. Leaf400]|uniref:hypothetical protein n=1 Tax=Ramlibacter sp. Leaf400 TaxID=1736365 RepID=UPI0006F3FA26|nr:hypothetical protein [Ramlibacter sp. Leaf400]KQT10955.1 hypothetical protein ASG30_09155 [Ramlibacter sp. Leaf400]
MKVVFFYGKQPQSFLCRLFTGSSCYHVGFTDGEKLWDMNLLRRRRVWSEKAAGKYILVDTPVPVTASFLESRLESDGSRYGVLDYLSFGLRRFFKRMRVNGKGLICSEMAALDLMRNGWLPRPGFPEVPSPADLEEALLERRNAITSRA